MIVATAGLSGVGVVVVVVLVVVAAVAVCAVAVACFADAACAVDTAIGTLQTCCCKYDVRFCSSQYVCSTQYTICSLFVFQNLYWSYSQVATISVCMHTRVFVCIYIYVYSISVCVCVYVRGIFSLILASFCWWKMKNVLAYHLKETINPPKRRTFIYRFVSSYFGKTFFRKQFCLVCLFSLFFFSKLISKKNWFSSVDSLIASLRTLSMYFVFFFSKRCTRRARIAAADAIAAEQLLPLQLLMMLLRLLMNPF